MDVPSTTMDAVQEIGNRTVTVLGIKTDTAKGTGNKKKVVSNT
jgi:hypothetical protein